MPLALPLPLGAFTLLYAAQASISAKQRKPSKCIPTAHTHRRLPALLETPTRFEYRGSFHGSGALEGVVVCRYQTSDGYTPICCTEKRPSSGIKQR
jgi:hypothetical protein